MYGAVELHAVRQRNRTTPAMASPDQFYDILKDSTSCIAAEFFLLPVADSDPVHRERVYCYELYHQLRCRWHLTPVSLNGEVDKAGHPHFRPGPHARSKPDLLVHHPGNMELNLVAVEVKPTGRPVHEYLEDLTKLTWYCRNARYNRGALLVYGGFDSRALLSAVTTPTSDLDLTRLDLFLHDAVGSAAYQVEWPKAQSAA
jgi:hypothetical protein